MQAGYAGHISPSFPPVCVGGIHLKKLNIFTGFIFLAVGIFAYVSSLGMVAKNANDVLGPSFWPKILAVIMIILSVMLFVESLLMKSDIPSPIDIHSEGFHRVLKIFVVLVIFAVLIYFAGIYIAMLFMMPAVMYLHGEKKIPLMAGITVGMIVFVYLVFGKALHVPLPEGRLFL